MTDTKYYPVGVEMTPDYYIGEAGTAVIVKRMVGAIGQQYYPFAVMMACNDGEGIQSCETYDEAREVAAYVSGSGTQMSTSVSYLHRQRVAAVVTPCQGCGADIATDTCCESRQPRPIQQWLD
jgi:hypothetical protein